MKSFTLLIIILSSLVLVLRAQSVEPLPSQAPYFYVPDATGSTDKLPLKSTDVDVEIAGVIADVTISQKYINQGKAPLEAVYVFPAATRAAVYDMQMKIGKRILIAKIAEKGMARKNYEKAKKQGKSASLLEQDRPNVFRMNVANIMPGDTIITVLKYTELLIPEKGTYQFVFPTVVGPRYAGEDNLIRPTTPGMANTEQDYFNHNPYLNETKLGEAIFAMSIHLKSPIPIAKVESTSHRISIDKISKKYFLVELGETYGGNRDFIIAYQLNDQQIQTGVMISENGEENFFLAMIQPPERADETSILPREYIFIVDVSGSMSGFPLETSKKMIKRMLSEFRPEDRFNLVLFAAGTTLFSQFSLPANIENINHALHFMDKHEGAGGTNLVQALELALQLPDYGNISKSFILLSDGYVTVEKEAIQKVRNYLAQDNFFAIGVGSSVNRLIMEGLAYAGQGEPIFLTHPDHIDKQIDLFKSYVEAPLLSDINYSFEGFSALEVQPVVLPDLLAQRPLILFGKYQGNSSGKLSIYGKTRQGKYASHIMINTAEKINGNALQNLWARDAIRLLADYEYLEEKDKERVIDLSLKYNLLTEFTSFYAIDTVVNNHGFVETTTIRQALPLPQGVTNHAVTLSSDIIEFDFDIEIDEEVIFEAVEYDISPEQVFTIVEMQPEFPGGYDSLYRFVQAHLKYPENLSIEGKIFVQFVVDVDGSVTEVKILKGLHPVFDAEALRVIKMLPKWKPGKQRGRPVKVRMIIPVQFRL